MRRPALLASLTISLVAGAFSAVMAAMPQPLNDLTSFILMRTDGREPAVISVDQAADALKDFDVIFLGEFHDHAGNHLAEMQLLSALYARAPQLTLSLEQFERDVQPVLDDYLAGRIGEDTLKEKGRAWPNYAEAYRPLVEYAKEHALPVIAANAPASIVRCVGQEGPEALAKLAPEKRSQAAAELHLADSPYKDKFLRFLAEDPLHGEDGVDRSNGPAPSDLRAYASQVTRDDTMAESIFLHRQKNPGRKVVHITGNFHVEGFLGTAERLKLRAPDAKIAVVAPVEVADPKAPALQAGDIAAGNFVVMLRASPKAYANAAEEKAAVDRMRAMFRRPARSTPCTP